MTPVIKTKPTRLFKVALASHVMEVAADTISEPDRRSDHYTLELEGEIVAKFPRHAVLGWSVSE